MYHTGQYIVTEVADSEPITLEEAKTFLKVDTDADDTLISAIISAARDSAERYCQVSMLPVTIEETFDRFFPYGLRLSVSPVIEVESVQYLPPSASVMETLSESNYNVHAQYRPPLISRKEFATWPTIASQAASVKVTYTAGFADVDAIPPVLKLAMLRSIAEMYQNRQDGVMTLPTAVQHMLNQYRVQFFR